MKRIIIILMGLFVLFGMVIVGDATIYQFPDEACGTFYGANGLSLYDGTMAWSSDNREIRYWDGSSVRTISDESIRSNQQPSLFDGTIAWMGETDRSEEIFFWDGAATTQLTNNDVWDLEPSLFNGSIAWNSEYNISYWNGNTVEIVGSGVEPILYDGTIAFMTLSREIYYWDGNSTTPVTTTIDVREGLSYHGGTMAWSGVGAKSREIFYTNGGSIQQLTDNNVRDNYSSVYDGTIAWVEYDFPGDVHTVKYWNGTSTMDVYSCSGDSGDRWLDNVSLYDGTLAWGEVEMVYDNGGHSYRRIFYWDGGSTDEFVIGFPPTIQPSEPCTTDIHPDTLNKKSKGKYITCYIELPDGYNVANIDIETIMLSFNGNSILAESSPTEIGDYNDNGITDLMVKFDRQLVQDACGSGAVEMILTCQTYDETNFEGSDTVSVKDEGQEHYSEDHGSVIY